MTTKKASKLPTKHSPGNWTAEEEMGTRCICIVPGDGTPDWFVNSDDHRRLSTEDDAKFLAAVPQLEQERDDLWAWWRAFLDEYEDVSSEYHFGNMLDSAFSEVLAPVYALLHRKAEEASDG